jgi:Cu2+-exporting ATPase
MAFGEGGEAVKVKTHVKAGRNYDGEGGWQHLKQDVGARLAVVDERYQRFMQDQIDPLLGLSHHAELTNILNQNATVLRPAERYANYRLGMGLAAFGLSLLGTLVFAPLMPLAILVGFGSSSAKYPEAYRQWKAKKKIGAIHLICVYSLCLWFGGFASIGALGAMLYGLMLKARAVGEGKSRDNLISMFQLQPDKVWVRADGNEIEIPFRQLQIGDTLVLRAGQTVPVDGTISAGVATIDQHMLTGEAQPVEKRAGDGVLAATLLISGQIDVAVEKTSTETTAGQIAEVLNRTLKDAKPVSVSAVEAADKYALPTLAVCAVSLPFIGPAGAASLLGANTTTASYLSGSLAMLNFLNLTAKNGVLVKEARALEQLGSVDTIVFDKTGTLTLEQPHVAQVHTLNGLHADQVLTLAAAAEARQTHPIARAILDAAAEHDLPLPAIDHAHYEVGYGLKIRLAEAFGQGTAAPPLIRVGSGRFMAMEGLAAPERVGELTEACRAQGHSLVMVAANDEVVGCVELRPTVRPEAQAIIEGLRKRGLNLYIISGDHEAPTQKLAQDLGMTGYFANTLPEAKADLVAKLQAEGRRVCFIGDGINDALAMQRAQVSISLRGATTVATDTAQIVLMEGNLNRLPDLFQRADEFKRNLRQNIRLTSGISIAAVSGILLAGFSFVATEIFYSAALFGGLVIAMKPLLDERKRQQGKAATM